MDAKNIKVWVGLVNFLSYMESGKSRSVQGKGMGTHVRDERSLFDSTNDELGVGSTSLYHISIMQEWPTFPMCRVARTADFPVKFPRCSVPGVAELQDSSQVLELWCSRSCRVPDLQGSRDCRVHLSCDVPETAEFKTCRVPETAEFQSSTWVVTFQRLQSSSPVPEAAGILWDQCGVNEILRF